MLTQESTKTQTINWKPIIKKFVAVLGEKGVVQRKEELLTYECDGLTSYKQSPPRCSITKNHGTSIRNRQNLQSILRSLYC